MSVCMLILLAYVCVLILAEMLRTEHVDRM
jgi:hypothetical protein